jgi:hypothetical protein
MPQTCETPPRQAGLAKVLLGGNIRESTPNPDKNQASSALAAARADLQREYVAEALRLAALDHWGCLRIAIGDGK